MPGWRNRGAVQLLEWVEQRRLGSAGEAPSAMHSGETPTIDELDEVGE